MATIPEEKIGVFDIWKKIQKDKNLLLSDKGFAKKIDHCSKDDISPFPDLKTFALFAIAAYKTEVKIKSDMPDGWELLTTGKNKALLNGYHAAAFWNRSKRQLIIAHRGTVWYKGGALYTDLFAIHLEQITPQVSSAVSFAEKIVKAIAKKVSHFQIFFTGHSLGGWLAQLTTLSCREIKLIKGRLHYGERHYPHTIVFESPGFQPMLTKLLDVQNRGEDRASPRLDISTYLTSPNVINVHGKHVGSIFAFEDEAERRRKKEKKTSEKSEKAKANDDNEDNEDNHKVNNEEDDDHDNDNDNDNNDENKNDGRIKKIKPTWWNYIPRSLEAHKMTLILSYINNGDPFSLVVDWPHKQQEVTKSKRHQQKEVKINQCRLHIFSEREEKFLKTYQGIDDWFKREFKNYDFNKDNKDYKELQTGLKKIPSYEIKTKKKKFKLLDCKEAADKEDTNRNARRESTDRQTAEVNNLSQLVPYVKMLVRRHQGEEDIVEKVSGISELVMKRFMFKTFKNSLPMHGRFKDFQLHADLNEKVIKNSSIKIIHIIGEMQRLTLIRICQFLEKVEEQYFPGSSQYLSDSTLMKPIEFFFNRTAVSQQTGSSDKAKSYNIVVEFNSSKNDIHENESQLLDKLIKASKIGARVWLISKKGDARTKKITDRLENKDEYKDVYFQKNVNKVTWYDLEEELKTYVKEQRSYNFQGREVKLCELGLTDSCLKSSEEDTILKLISPNYVINIPDKTEKENGDCDNFVDRTIESGGEKIGIPEMSKCKKTVVIGEPKSGKTALRKKIAEELKKRYPDSWVYNCSFNRLRHEKYTGIKSIYLTDILNLKGFSKQIFEQLAKTPRKIFLLIDRLDELPSKYKEIISEILKELEKTEIHRIFFQGNMTTSEEFEKFEYTKCYLKPFSTEQREQFLASQFCLAIPERTKKIIEAFEMTGESEDADFVRSPENLKLVLEYAKKTTDSEEAKNMSDVDIVCDVVKTLVEEKFRNFEERSRPGNPISETQHRYYTQGLHLFLEFVASSQFLEIPAKTLEQKSKKYETGYVNLNLAEKRNGGVRFKHSFVRDYFAASHVVRMRPECFDFLFPPGSEYFKRFLRIIVAKDFDEPIEF